MEYTKNYKLPQWVESDRIMMEDFNQAMADIEAAIVSKADDEETAANTAALEQRITAAEQSVRFLKLGGPVVTTAADQTVTFSLADIDLTEYTALLVVAGAAHSSGSVNLLVNGSTLMTLCSNNWSQSAAMAWMLPGSGKVLAISQECQSSNESSSESSYLSGTTSSLALDWGSISSISVAGYSNAGMRCTLYGLKG